MDKRDVLISDIRVTALAKNGQYVFEWVDEDQKTITIVPEESNFTEVPQDVLSAIQANGLQVVEEDIASSVDESTNTASDTPDTSTSNSPTSGSQPEPIGTPVDSTDDSSTDSINPIDPVEPAQSEMNEQPTTESSGNLMSEPDEPDDNNDSETTNEDVSRNETAPPESKDEDELVSFLVRMTDPGEREQIVQQLKDADENAAKKLQLTGPFRITYRVTDEGLELAGVEDLGIGSAVGETD